MKKGKRLLAWCLAFMMVFGNVDLGMMQKAYAAEIEESYEAASYLVGESGDGESDYEDAHDFADYESTEESPHESLDETDGAAESEPESFSVPESFNMSESVSMSESESENEDTSTDETAGTYELKENIKFRDDDIAYDTYGNITWVIDADGTLTVEGEGEFSASKENTRAPWYSQREKIKTAVVRVTGMQDASLMFYDCSNMTSLDLSGFDTSSVTNMGNMFYGCSGLTSLDVSKFNTSRVTDMKGMFSKCCNLTSLDVSGFNTGNVTDMQGMFDECNSLTSLDVSRFDTSNVTSMFFMFNNCSSLTSLDVSGFNTSSVTHMKGMFSGCSGLTYLDVSKFNTSSVTNMSYMFSGCSGLTSLDMSGFNTSNVTDMSGMFGKCSGLTSLDVSSFNTSGVTDMSSMFYGCSGLASLDVSGFNTGSVTDMIAMFYNCSGLTSLDVSGFKTSGVTNMYCMFYNCSGLRSLDVSGLDTSSVTDMGYMFSDCSGLTSLDVSGFNTSSVTNMLAMFADCSGLTSLDVSSFNTSSVTDMSGMFYKCSGLTSLDVGCFDTSNVMKMDDMFYDCSSLMSLDMSGFDTSNVTDMRRMLYGCSGLTTLYTPYNVNTVQECDLPTAEESDIWYDAEGNTYTEFPQGLDYSIILMRNSIPGPEFPDDGSFHVSPVSVQTYTGSAIKPAVRVYYGSHRLTEKTDYTIAYKNNIKANDATDEKTAPTIIVTGKGDYSGKQTITFIIRPKDITSVDVTAAELVAAQGNKVQKPVPTLTYKGKKLKKGTDFTVSYPDEGKAGAYQTAGTYTITINGTGNYTGARKLNFTITNKTLLNKAKVTVKAKDYTGSAVTLNTDDITVKVGKATLVYGTDYTLSYRNNTQAGKATVIVTGVGEKYAGSKEAVFQINGKSIAKAQVSGLSEQTYAGTAQTPKLQVQLDGKTLQEGTDYKLSYANAVNAGKATVTITGKGGYTGSVKKTFKIAAYDLQANAGGKLQGVPNSLTVAYTKGGATPVVDLAFNGKQLIEKTDYTITYKNNKKPASASDAKAPTITIKGKGNFKGTLTIPFAITASDFTASGNVEIAAADTPFVDKAGKYMAKPVLTDANGKKLAAGTDYEKTFTYTLVNADGTDKPLTAADTVPEGGVVKVSVTGKGNYTGTISTTYRITKASFSKAKVTVAAQSYTGSAVTLSAKDITVKLGSDTLTYGKDYTIVEESYRNNIKKGTATVTIKGMGDYGGMKTVKFKIVARQLTLSK